MSFFLDSVFVIFGWSNIKVGKLNIETTYYISLCFSRFCRSFCVLYFICLSAFHIWIWVINLILSAIKFYFYDKFQHLKFARIMLLIATDDIDIPDHMCHHIFIDSLYNMLWNCDNYVLFCYTKKDLWLFGKQGINMCNVLYTNKNE